MCLSSLIRTSGTGDIIAMRCPQHANICLGCFYPEHIFVFSFCWSEPNCCHNRKNSLSPSTRSSNHRLASKDNNRTAAVAATTWLNEYGRRVLPWSGRGGCTGCPGSAAPAHHPVLRMGAFLPALLQAHMHVPNTRHPTGSRQPDLSFLAATSKHEHETRPRCGLEPSGVRGPCSLPSYLEKHLLLQ